MSNKVSVLGGVLLVAGTSIGGGILGLPIMTGLAGFFPALVVYIVSWLFMTITGLLFVEIALYMKEDTNFISMAKKTLGWPGVIFSWVTYIFMFYSLTVAYVAGGGATFFELSGGMLSLEGACALFVLLLAPFVYKGAQAVSRLNALFMVGLGGTYVLLIALGAPSVSSELVMRREWSLVAIGLPIAFTSFAYQGIVPTLCRIFDRNARLLRRVVVIGSALPLFVYGLWEWLILGIVPLAGPYGLAETLLAQQNAVEPLQHFIGIPWVPRIGQAFAFFTLVTSFLGVTLGLRDFLADGLSLALDRKGRILTSLLIFVPALLFTWFNPDIFLSALNLAGGVGVALLLGLLPILMVWIKRYRDGILDGKMFAGGKPVFVVLIAFVVVLASYALLQEFGVTDLAAIAQSKV